MKAIILKIVQCIWYFITSPYYAFKALFSKDTASEQPIREILSNDERRYAAGIDAYRRAKQLVTDCEMQFLEDPDKLFFYVLNRGKKVARVSVAFPTIAGIDAPVFVTGLIPRLGAERENLKFVAKTTWTCYDSTILARWAGNKHYIQLYELEEA